MKPTEELRELTEAISSCIDGCISELTARDCNLPFAMRLVDDLVDDQGEAAAGEIDEDGAIDLTFERVPTYPFTIELVDYEQMCGHRLELREPS